MFMGKARKGEMCTTGLLWTFVNYNRKKFHDIGPFHFERNIIFPVKGSSESSRSQAVPLHELARPRRAEPPSAGAHLHSEVGGSQPRRRRTHHRSLQRWRRPDRNLHRHRLHAATGINRRHGNGISLSVWQPVLQSSSISIWFFICLSFCPSDFLSVHLSSCLPFCFPFCLYAHLLYWLPMCLSVVYILSDFPNTFCFFTKNLLIFRVLSVLYIHQFSSVCPSCSLTVHLSSWLPSLLCF